MARRVMSARIEVVLVALVLAFFIDTALVGEIASIAFPIAYAALRPRSAPALLVLISGMQDGRGLSLTGGYIAFALVSLIMVVRLGATELLLPNHRHLQNVVVPTPLKALVVGALIVTVYGFLITAIYELHGIWPRGLSRPFWIVTPVIALMIITGYYAAKLSVVSSSGVECLRTAAIVVLVHELAVMVLQLFFEQDSFRSLEGQIVVSEGTELIVPREFGFPRLNGPFLSPNALATNAAAMMVITFVLARRKHFGITAVLLFLFLGTAVSLGTLSKSNLLFFMAVPLVLCFYAENRARTLLVLLVCVTPVMVWSLQNRDIIEGAFRFSMLDTSYRGAAWYAVFEHFHPIMWIVGAGIGFWRDFFEATIGLSISEPHSYVLSIPGTFGVIGIAYYLMLGAILLWCVYRAPVDEKRLKAALWMLICALFIREGVTDQTVLGNTPFTFILWLTISLIFLLVEQSKQSSRQASTVIKKR